MATTPVFLPGESQGRGSLVGCCLWGRTELDRTEATWQQPPREESNLQKGKESEKPSEMWEGLKRIPGWYTFLPMSPKWGIRAHKGSA